MKFWKGDPVKKQSGGLFYRRVSLQGRSMLISAANQHEILEENLYISQDGYLETFVVNETAEDVWPACRSGRFDNFMVMSTTSLVFQETHVACPEELRDPWGLELTGLGFQAGGLNENKYLYNGKEYVEDHGVNIYDYGARMYSLSRKSGTR